MNESRINVETNLLLFTIKLRLTHPVDVQVATRYSSQLNSGDVNLAL